MSRGEIKYPASASMITAAAAEYVSPGIPANKHQIIRRRYFKWFPIHFRMRNFKAHIQSLGNRMAAVHDPHPFLLSDLSPSHLSRCSQNAVEYF